ncbi:MAG TPA: tryptophan synthase subunit alpha [Desulfuromonadales bacterium]|nr:tryptophan synthase subunit alpha [Desulfuromonadales bacterium]
MSRLAARFAALHTDGSKALVTFITAGDPDLAVTEEMIQLLEHSGADVIELGVPFSDPMADGPTIQRSSERALNAGTTLHGILELVKRVRTRCEIPIILMGYLNPVHAYGFDRFCRDASDAGVDGILLVDMPPEESSELTVPARLYGIDVIFLLTPTSDSERIAAVESHGSGFVYYVTVTGVTGTRTSVSTSLAQELARVNQAISLPVMAGFGISTPEQAAEVGKLADGIVVGSAIVKLFEQLSGEELKQKVGSYVAGLKQAIA